MTLCSILKHKCNFTLLQVFSHLTNVGPCWENNDDPWFIKKLPFRNNERDEQPHPGIRAYPFLGQVCRKWKSLLATPNAQVKVHGESLGGSNKALHACSRA